ncbi:MAG: DUF3347 domain-containing protein [Sphingobacteriaceae bacterium]|nr:MAG: DUF3347 domain-containing protein [Sphingobacteriaceae bacterium]
MKKISCLMLMITLLIFSNVKAQNTVITTNNLLNAYLDIEKALFNSNIKLANKNAEHLVNYTAEVIPAKLNADEKKSWTAYGEKLRYNAQHISESTTIDHQREHFAALSDAMYGLLKTFKTHPTVYRQYCPMKKQYWLNASQEIQNPYYGKEMPDCGKVTETLTGKVSAMMLN